jgi:subtilase family serine protease
MGIPTDCTVCHTEPGVQVLPNNISITCGQCHGGGTNPADNPPSNNVFWRSDAALAAGASGMHRADIDLVMLSVSAANSAKRGGTITVYDATKNRLGGGAGASRTAVYLSTNTTWDAGDTLLNSRAVPALAGGAVNSGSMSVTIPAGTAPGTYYLIWKADYLNAVAEADETNNTKYKAITITN